VRLTYRVPSWLTAVMAAGAGAAAALAVRVNGPGRLLFTVAAAGAAFEAVRALRPTLVADAEGFDVLVGVRVERHPWTHVEDLGALRPPEAGARPRRRANALEIDLGERLLVLPAYRLGAPVPDVAATLAELRGIGP
jgi:hypothetical protein